ncbi:MAG: ABC transporter permease subunit [Syntrophales bacterium]|nr:ABC transporter permease subunit [Syntrophales bacterium]
MIKKWHGREGLLFMIILIILWQGISLLATAKFRFLFPALPIIANALWDSLPELLTGTYSSFLILGPGYLLAVAAGLVAGILTATTGWISRAFMPFAKVAAPVPPTIYIPYAIALMATFRSASILVVFIGAFWPVFLNTAAGAAAIPGRYRDDARILGMSHFDSLRKIVFPASLPHSFSGMAVGLAMSFILLTVAELFGANAGLGRFVQYYADYADYPRMVAGSLYTGLITFLSMAALEGIKKRVLFWVK